MPTGSRGLFKAKFREIFGEAQREESPERYSSKPSYYQLNRETIPGFSVNNTQIRAFLLYQGRLYIGTVNTVTGAEVWSTDGLSWRQETPGWAANQIEAVWMILYNGLLVVSTYSAAGGQVWTFNGTTWANITPAWAATNLVAWPKAVYRGYLYCGSYNPTTGPQLWRYNGVAWAQITFPAELATNIVTFGINNLRELIVYKEKLYLCFGYSVIAGPTTQKLLIWTLDYAGNFADVTPSFAATREHIECVGSAIYKGNLYVGSTSGTYTYAHLMKYDGVSWSEIAPPWHSGVLAPRQLLVFDDLLYIALYHAAGAAGELYAYDGEDFEQIMVPTGYTHYNYRGLGVFQNKLWLGTGDILGELWSIKAVDWKRVLTQLGEYPKPEEYTPQNAVALTVSGGLTPSNLSAPIYVAHAESLYLQARNGASTNLTINILSSPDNTIFDDVAYTLMNMGANEEKSMLIAKGPVWITVQAVNGDAANATTITTKLIIIPKH